MFLIANQNFRNFYYKFREIKKYRDQIIFFIIKDGVHQLRDPLKEYTQEELMLMKTQDKNYIKMRHQIEMNVNGDLLLKIDK